MGAHSTLEVCGTLRWWKTKQLDGLRLSDHFQCCESVDLSCISNEYFLLKNLLTSHSLWFSTSVAPSSLWNGCVLIYLEAENMLE